MSARTALAAALRTALPPRLFDVRDEEDLPDKPTKTVVIVRHRDYTPAPNAAGTMLSTFLVTIATHHIDRSKAEDALDDRVPAVLEALENHAGLTWSRASRVLLKETYLGYDVEALIDFPRPY